MCTVLLYSVLRSCTSSIPVVLMVWTIIGRKEEEKRTSYQRKCQGQNNILLQLQCMHSHTCTGIYYCTNLHVYSTVRTVYSIILRHGVCFICQACRSTSDCSNPSELCDPDSGSCRRFLCSRDLDCPVPEARCHEGIDSKFCSSK